ncbi:glycerate kinase [Halorussus salinisoli]|uniref:glycerate kinase n=1 Tax=Halorussus salinisoli TaxID=2558242 RepID=UPI0010C21533|nr:glycerate kinase [Halorussus salinisoli]
MIRNRDELAGSPSRALALDCVAAGVEAARPRRVVREAVELDADCAIRTGPTGTNVNDLRVLVVGAGQTEP